MTYEGILLRRKYSGRRRMGKKDITHKSFFENPEWFADLMNAAFFGGEEILAAGELLPEDGALQKADETVTTERLRDVVKKQTKDGSTFAMYILENQSTVDYSMLIRIMVEESLTYDKQVKEIRRANKTKFGNVLKEDEFVCGFRKSDRLAPVFTLVLYWGDKEWDAAVSLKDMVAVPAADYYEAKRVRDLIPNYRIKVFDLNKVKDFSLFKTALRTVFEFYSCRKSKEVLKRYLSNHEGEVKALDEESMFLLTTMIKEKRLFKKLARKEKKEEEDMCEAIQGMIEEGIAQGKAEGKEEGKAEGRAAEKVEDILIVLNEQGVVSKYLDEKIRSEKDMEILNKWFRLAIKAKTISEFEAAM